MPVVMVKRANDDKVDNVDYATMLSKLPGIVANALNAPPDGFLDEADISVLDVGSSVPFYEVNRHAISIVVFAHDFPERMLNLDNRCSQIIERCKEYLPSGTTLSVWVLCMPTSWGEAVVA